MSASTHAERHHDEIVVPRPVVYMTVALMLFAIVTVTVGRWMQWGVTHEGALTPTRESTFRFVQSFHGPVVATRSDGTVIVLAHANEEAFPRLVLRSVANLRARDAVDPASPMSLMELADGERMLVDHATGRTLRLAAYGPDNQHTFDRLFPAAATVRR